jgi:hemerythrin-like domain-containing protein
MVPSDMLSEEIEHIYCMLDILEVMHSKLLDNQDVNLDDLRKVINFFHNFAHKSHNKKEENVLIPELKKHNNVYDNSLFKEIIMENHLAEFYITILKKLLKDVGHGDDCARAKLITMLKKYLTLEKKHVQKEEIYILPLCKQMLSKSKYNRIMTEFKLVDEAEFGSGMYSKFHDAFSQVISSMQKQYYTKN